MGIKFNSQHFQSLRQTVPASLVPVTELSPATAIEYEIKMAGLRQPSLLSVGDTLAAGKVIGFTKGDDIIISGAAGAKSVISRKSF